MRLKNNFSFFIITTMLSTSLMAASQIPILITKQPSNKICFVSKDGKYTYYQKRPTTLVLAHMYSLNDVLTGPPEAVFNVYASSDRKKMVVEMVPYQYHNVNSMSLNYLYLMDFGGRSVTPLGNGISPKLHLDDTWISYYNSYKKVIYFQEIKNLDIKKQNQQQKFKIELKNFLNPYFVPQVIMFSEDLILFSDNNLEGVSALLLLNRNKQKLITLVKARRAGVKIEICLNKTKLFVGQFPYPDINAQSEIGMIDLNVTKDFTKMETLYRSDLADIGNIECQSEQGLLFFVQNQSDKSDVSVTRSELVALELKSKKIITITDLSYVSQVINMDSRLMVPFRGDFYVIKGDTNLNTDKLINTKIKGRNNNKSKNAKLGISSLEQTSDVVEVQSEGEVTR
ncbi:MAG: hypothetical protein HQK49_10205 [Oligoflexia bacterium]|nr:hypothetical protein [Oligoflexia bacterium]